MADEDSSPNDAHLFTSLKEFYDAAAGDSGFDRDQAITLGFYVIQTIILICCVSIRYFWFRDVGLYSLRVSRPR